jgi:hypothetical protein
MSDCLARLENRQADLLGLYAPFLDEDEAVERRLPADLPSDLPPHRILVLCHHLKSVPRHLPLRPLCEGVCTNTFVADTQ